MIIEDLGVGVDIEDIKRFEKYATDRNARFVKRVFTKNEIEYCFAAKSPAKHLAARFCAKEAIYKAFCSLGITNLGFLDVEILHDSNKVPSVFFLNDNSAGYHCKLSLSHSKDQAIASVVIIKQSH